jgi:DNA helicase-2/ATP-dependent DNA helicase PcrA
MIRCGHCGDSHATVAEVRDCAGRPNSGPVPDLATDSSRAGPIVELTAPGPVALEPSMVPILAGPDELGRWLLVSPGQPAPPPWDTAPRFKGSDCLGTATSLSPDLETARRDRRRVVVELDIATDRDVEPPDPRRWWSLAPDMALEPDWLRRRLAANAVDLTGERPRFEPLEQAVAAGAVIGEQSDVVLRDGNPAWCDGGPLAWFDGLDGLAAVSHEGGSARIIAPAGSGKTRVLTERVRHMVVDRGVDPSATCLVAFNVRARDEMQERTGDVPSLEVRTLNSLALAICNGTGPFAAPMGHRRVTVIEEHQVRRILDELVTVPRRAMADPMAAWIEALTSTRLGLRDPALVESDFGGDVKGFAEVAPLYVAALDERGLVDFDQQILRAIEILITDTRSRSAARRACRQLLVDEFQDLTPAHVLLVRLLSGPLGEVYGVGDDDQTIYGYSGASPAFLIGFSDLFPGASEHDLHVNYRCPPEVVEAASNLLTHNRVRVHKTITARADRDTDGALVIRSADEPAHALVEHVTELLQAGARPGDLAVLSRVNATLLAPFTALTAAGIPTTKPIDASFLQRTGAAAALAWMRLATTPESSAWIDVLETAARRPPRALSPRLVGWISEKSSIADIRALARRLNEDRDRDKVLGFADHLQMLQSLAADGADSRALLETIRDEIGLGRALDTRLDASRRAVDRSSHSDDLAALLAIADLHPDATDFPEWLAGLLQSASHAPDGVRLSTIHRVKGREWPHVIVYEASEGSFPHRLADSVEEERRVFHVALTRCSESVLVLSGPRPSRFVEELSERVERRSESPHRWEAGAAGGSSPTPVPTGEPASTIEIASLRERLREWRRQRSRADGVPAYVVFSDSTLHDLAERRPIDESELLAVAGIGPKKLDMYGADILEILHGAAGDRP